MLNSSNLFVITYVTGGDYWDDPASLCDTGNVYQSKKEAEEALARNSLSNIRFKIYSLYDYFDELRRWN